MAQILQINNGEYYSDKALIMGYREARQYDMNISDYSEIRMGFLVSMVDSSTLQTTTGLHQNVPSYTGLKDGSYFGLKQTNTSFPGQGANFIGFRHGNSNGTDIHAWSQHYRLRDYRSYLLTLQSDGTEDRSVASTSGTESFKLGGNYNVGTNPTHLACWNYVKVVVNNKGQPNQSVTLTWHNTGEVSPSSGNYTTLEIQNYFQTYTTVITQVTKDWNDGSSALPLPKSLFIYWPYSAHRLAIHGIGVEIENI